MLLRYAQAGYANRPAKPSNSFIDRAESPAAHRLHDHAQYAAAL
jgi:hypothetical protein